MKFRSLFCLVGFILLAFFSLTFFPLLGKKVFAFSVWGEYPTLEHPLSELSVQAKMFWGLRLPNTILAMLAGCGLSMSGMIFQAIFRNPLATPYTLGVASGASFGATTVLLFSASLLSLGFPASFLGLPLLTWGAFAGAMLAIAVVFGLARKEDSRGERMLLSGVAVSFFFSSLILCLQYISDPGKAFHMIRWVMGGIDAGQNFPLGTFTGLIIVSSSVLLCFSRELNIMLTGDDRAVSLGVDINRLRIFLFIFASLLVGAIVSVCGPIGFVGLMAPHLCRLMVGADHRVLAPASFFFGAFFLGLCYTVSRSVLYPVELPVGIVTSLLGGPFFLILLMRKKSF